MGPFYGSTVSPKTGQVPRLNSCTAFSEAHTSGNASRNAMSGTATEPPTWSNGTGFFASHRRNVRWVHSDERRELRHAGPPATQRIAAMSRTARRGAIRMSRQADTIAIHRANNELESTNRDH